MNNKWNIVRRKRIHYRALGFLSFFIFLASIVSIFAFRENIALFDNYSLVFVYSIGALFFASIIFLQKMTYKLSCPDCGVTIYKNETKSDMFFEKPLTCTDCGSNCERTHSKEKISLKLVRRKFRILLSFQITFLITMGLLFISFLLPLLYFVIFESAESFNQFIKINPHYEPYLYYLGYSLSVPIVMGSFLVPYSLYYRCPHCRNQLFPLNYEDKMPFSTALNRMKKVLDEKHIDCAYCSKDVQAKGKYL